MDVEAALIGKIIHTGDLTNALEHKVRSEWFVDVTHRTVWDRVREYFMEFSEVPSKRVIRREFPEYVLDAAPESYEYYLTEMGTSRKRFLLLNGIADAAAKMEDSPDLSLEALQSVITSSQTEVSQLRDTNLTTTWEARLERYDVIQENQGRLLGIPLGIPTIDNLTAGFRPEQLISIIGEKKSGKSTIGLYGAKTAHDYGYVPLVIGFEMSNAEQEARFDAMLAGVDHRHLTRGGLTDEERERLEKALRGKRSSQEFILSSDIESNTTVSGIAAKIHQYQPDIVYVDGVYMMQDEEGGRDERQQLTNITRSFKRLAQRTKTPIVITTQALGWKVNKKTGIDSNAAGYSSSFGQDSNTVIGVETLDAEDPEFKRIRITDARDHPTGETVVRVDWKTGTIYEVDEYYDTMDEFGPEDL